MSWKDKVEQQEALRSAAQEMGITLRDKDQSAARQLLIDQIEVLLNENFDKLVSILYRLDVDEDKLRQLVKQNNGQNAAVTITDLIIERELQRLRSRKSFKRKEGEGDWP